MKTGKALSYLLALLLCATLLPGAARAETVASGTCGDDLTWTLDDKGTLTISGMGDMWDYEKTYLGLQYEEWANVKKIVINNGVTSIGDYVFMSCKEATSVSIPGTVKTIGDYSFCLCKKLSAVDIPNSVTSIGFRAFSACLELTSVSIPASVTSIDWVAFPECKKMTSISVAAGNKYFSSKDGVLFDKTQSKLIEYPAGKESDTYTVPSGVTGIGDCAFMSCYNLKSVILPDGVKSIGDSAFSGNRKMTSVVIPDSVTSIGKRAFSSLENITSINIPFGVTVISEGTFTNCKSLTSVSIPGTVSLIDKRAFHGCGGLRSVTVGGGVTTIDDAAFLRCDSLTDVYYDGSNAVWNAIAVGSDNDSLTSATLHFGDGGYCDRNNGTNLWWTLSGGTLTIAGTGDMENYGEEDPAPWYDRRTGIQTLVVGSGVTGIGSFAFWSCTGLTGVTVPDSVESIGTCAFADCTSLTSVTIGSGVETIQASAFLRCTALEEAVISDVAAWCGISFPNITANPITYAEKLYLTDGDSEPELITELKIPDGVTRIGKMAFYKCASLESVAIPDSVTEIEEDAFGVCTALETLTIPDSVERVGAYAFADCTSLASAEIGSGLSQIGRGFLSYCDSLTSLSVSDKNTGLVSLDNVLFGKADNSLTILLQCPGGKTGAYVIPDGVKYIGIDAFAGCNKLTSVTIPDSVTAIGNNAFEWCNRLESVTIGSGVKSIGDLAFSKCKALKNLTISDVAAWCGVQLSTAASNPLFNAGRLGGHMYLKDSASAAPELITSLTIPDGVTFIGQFAFEDCADLKSVIIPDGVTGIGRAAFSGSGLTRVSIGSGLIGLGAIAFAYCDNLTELTVSEKNQSFLSEDNVLFFSNNDELMLVMCPGGKTGAYVVPSGVTAIGNDAFLDCKGLKNIYLPLSLRSIGEDAFSGCTGLTDMTVPESVTYIGDWAFTLCQMAKLRIEAESAIGKNTLADSKISAVYVGKRITVGSVSPDEKGYTLVVGCDEAAYVLVADYDKDGRMTSFEKYLLAERNDNILTVANERLADGACVKMFFVDENNLPLNGELTFKK